MRREEVIVGSKRPKVQADFLSIKNSKPCEVCTHNWSATIKMKSYEWSIYNHI
jgi:hypothetical protein